MKGERNTSLIMVGFAMVMQKLGISCWWIWMIVGSVLMVVEAVNTVLDFQIRRLERKAELMKALGKVQS